MYLIYEHSLLLQNATLLKQWAGLAIKVCVSQVGGPI